MDKVTIQFTITIDDRDIIAQHANRARLTISQFCKMVIFSRINNYPLKKSKNSNNGAIERNEHSENNL